MVRVHKSSRYLVVETGSYLLRHDADRPWLASLEARGDVPVAELFVAANVDPRERPERQTGLAPPMVAREGEEAEVVFEGGSDLYAAKQYRFTCGDDTLTYRVAVEGTGEVAACRLWRGLLAEDAERVGLAASHFRPPFARPFEDTARGSVAAFQTVWSPRPNAAERDWLPPWANAVLDLIDDPARDGGLDSFLPAPAAVALELADGSWCGAGLAAAEDERTFASFAYRGGETFGFELGYDPPVPVAGRWVSPALELTFGARDPQLALRGLISRQAQRHEVSHWYAALDDAWREPVFDASGLEAEGARAALAALEQRGLRPGAVWLGRPSGPLLALAEELRERRLRVVVTWPLFAGGDLDAVLRAADGLRVVEARPPSGGIAALHGQLSALRSALRGARPGSLLIAPTVSPWFADIIDMVPLGGLWTDRASVTAMLRRRAEVARLASPTWLLAVGDWHCPGLAAWRELVALQPRLGVPVLSVTDALPASGERLEEDDWALLREAWRGRAR